MIRTKGRRRTGADRSGSNGGKRRMERIEISASVLPELNSSIDDVKAEIEKGVLNLFKKMAFEENTVRLSQINNIVYNSASVSDYADIKMNGAAENLVLSDVEIPKLKEVRILEQTR